MSFKNKTIYVARTDKVSACCFMLSLFPRFNGLCASFMQGIALQKLM